MKAIFTVLSLALAAGTLASCAAPPAYGNVEEVSRRSAVTPMPYTGEDTYVPAAVEYSRGRETYPQYARPYYGY